MEYRRRTLRTGGVGAVVFALTFLLLFACGDDGSSSPSAPADTDTPSAAASTTVASAAGTETPAASPAAIATAIASMPLEVKAGQLLMPGFDGTIVDEEVGALVDDYHVGNVVLLGRNAGAPDQLRALTRDLQQRARAANGEGMLIAIDQEGGDVTRLDPPFVQFPPARTIGCIGSARLAREAARIAGTEMRAAGLNMNLAPIADVADNPANTVIGDRAFGTTPDAVIEVLPSYVLGLRDADVASTVKHFPGHGSTDGDSHLGEVTLAKSRDELERTELPPFRAVAGMADVMMTSHVVYPALDGSGRPAALSKPIIDLLRNEMTFGGVIITDDLEMRAIQDRWSVADAAVEALNAGVDVLLFTSATYVGDVHATIVSAVQDGTIAESRLDESLARVLALKRRLLAVPDPPLSEIGSTAHQQFIDELDVEAAASGCRASVE